MQIIERHPVTTAPIEVALTPEEVVATEVFESYLCAGLSPSDAVISMHDALRAYLPNVAAALTPQFLDFLMP